MDAADFGAILKEVKAFDKRLGLDLRKQLRKAADPAVADVKAVLRQPTPGRGRQSKGVRAALIAGTSVRVLTGKRTQGVRIVTTAARLPEKHKPMLRLYAKTSFRHPVFGDRGVWVTQQGRPYFSAVIRGKKDTIAAAVGRALEDAADTIGRGNT